MDPIEKVALLSGLGIVFACAYFAQRYPLKVWKNFSAWQWKYPKYHEPSRSLLDLNRRVYLCVMLGCAIVATFIVALPSREQARLEQKRHEEWCREHAVDTQGIIQRQLDDIHRSHPHFATPEARPHSEKKPDSR